MLPLGAARLDLGEVEHLVDEPRQPLGLLDDDRRGTAARSAPRQVRVVVEDLGEGTDRGERRAQLVADRRDEVVLHAGRARAAARSRRAAPRSPPRARATSARAPGCTRAPATPRRGCSSPRRSRAAPPSRPKRPVARAEAEPMAPASIVSASCTRLGVGARRPRGREPSVAAGVPDRARRRAGLGPRNRPSSPRRSCDATRRRARTRPVRRGGLLARRPRTAPPGRARRRLGRRSSETPTYAPTLASMLQNMRVGDLVEPGEAEQLRAASAARCPSGPSSTNARAGASRTARRQAASSVYSQTANPASRARRARRRGCRRFQ